MTTSGSVVAAAAGRMVARLRLAMTAAIAVVERMADMTALLVGLDRREQASIRAGPTKPQDGDGIELGIRQPAIFILTRLGVHGFLSSIRGCDHRARLTMRSMHQRTRR